MTPREPIDVNMESRLTEDITLLDQVLDSAVNELTTPRTRQLLSRLRESALQLRSGLLDGGRDSFASQFAELSIDDLTLVARVFTQWFLLVNAAEEQHRIRVLRARDTQGSAPAESIAASCAELARAGVSADEIRVLLGRMLIMPVLTAHPTEARRRTVLDHLSDIATQLDTLDRGRLGARERERVLEHLRATVLALFATEESRTSKPSPRDEIHTGLAVFDGTLLDVTLHAYHVFEDALATQYPGESFDVPAFLRWGTWIGGDRDGNPFVTADTTRYVLEQQRRAVLARHVHDIDRLIRELSVSERRGHEHDASAMDALHRSLDIDREQLPEIHARIARYTVHEPWREKLHYMRERILATVERADAAYANADRYLEDLMLVRASLEAMGFVRLTQGALRTAIRRVQVFGFHLATLDLRQHSAVHERAVAELLDAAGHHGYLDMADGARIELLVGLLESSELTPPESHAGLSPETRELLTTLHMVGRARREQGPRACERYVVSFTSSASDLLEVLFLIRAARLSPGELRPVPLLEQLEDLDHAADIARAMLDIRPLRAALGDELEVMIGYSDAGKQIGYFAAAVALRRAQLALARVADERGVRLTIFHGRGGAIGRGGGPANQTIRAQPPSAVRGRLRVTEQGETVTARYSRAEIAARDLEQTVSAVLMAAVDERSPLSEDELSTRDLVWNQAATQAKDAYSRLLADRDLLARYALTATPIRQVTKLPIGSRPASRKPGLSFDDLRAIPWVFSWNQSRHGLPGWFGLGSALDNLIETQGVQRVRALYRESSFFRAIINNAQLALSRADIDVARHYAGLADAEARTVFDTIEREFTRTRERVLEVTEHQDLLGNAPHLVAAIQRRNPFVDILSHAQIELLRRLDSAQKTQTSAGIGAGADTDAADIERIRATLFITINGIAAGLQTAG